MHFKIRAQWWGPDGSHVGVADTVEAEDATPSKMQFQSVPANIRTRQSRLSQSTKLAR
jgi:hypothetical protein